MDKSNSTPASLPLLTSGMLVITHRCCLGCRYCFVNQENVDMTLDTAIDAANFFAKNGKLSGITPKITFFGGEPLLLWDEIIKPLTLYIREDLKSPFVLSITTNGILLTDEIMDFMKKYSVGILLSIDGDKETQDYNRPLHGLGSSFDILKDKVDKVIAMFPGTTFRSTITQPTCHLTWDNIKFAIDHKYTSVYTTPNVFESWTEKNKEILKGEIHKYSEYFVDCFRKGIFPTIFTSLEESMKKILVINSSNRNGEHRERIFCLSEGKCGLGSGHYCAISPDGNIYGCQEMTSNEGEKSKFYIGSLSSGVSDELRRNLMNSYAPSKATGLDCSACKYNRVCDGGCPANNYLLNGDIHINPKMYCWWRQLLLDEAIWIANVLGEEENQMFRRYWRGINNVKQI